jgi:branched-subunit amino acid aminotransferase/4-amino-4-deoxychorismate lyase
MPPDASSREPMAYVRGAFVPLSQASVPMYDGGYVQGATLSEQLRTFRGSIFLFDEHIARLRRGAMELGFAEAIDWASLRGIADELVELNFALLTPGGELGLAMLCSPGSYAAFSGGDDYGPTVMMHTYPLRFEKWQASYVEGVDLVITPQRQVPASCWPRSIKSRSRLHYLLADQAAQRVNPQARALLTDEAGHVTETAVANIVLCYTRDGNTRLTSPRRDIDILPGVSLGFVEQLARDLGWSWEERAVLPEELFTADELWLTSTPSCVLPVRSVDGRTIGGGRGWPMYQRLLTAWSGQVGLEIDRQSSHEPPGASPRF